MAYWAVAQKELPAMAIGWLIGTGIGVATHLYSHYSEGRMGEPSEGVPLHLMFDGARGMMVSLPILAISIAVFRGWRRAES